MHAYSASQWVLFFFFYCFCGWVWESCYVSVRKGRWVNRGFLHGPLLPIYGSGAIIILLATIPVAEDLRLVYLCGMIAATVLEYFTGAAMEQLFKVRYWDYSKQPFNLKGYICLSSSIAWGFFSILMVRFLHPPVARLLLRIPDFLADPAAMLLVAAATVDAVQSFHAAMDLREILTRLTEENEELRRLAKRAEVVSAFAEEDLRQFRERTELEKLLLQKRLEAEVAEHRQARAQRKRRRQELLEDAVRRGTEARLEVLENIGQALENCRDRLADLPDMTAEAVEERKADIAEAIRRVRERESAIRARSAKSYQRSLRILRGNPSASAKAFAEVLESLRDLGERK